MDFDIKKIIDEAVSKIQGNDQLLEQFKSNPVKAIESVTGLDLPDDQMSAVVTAVKAKIGGDGLMDKIGGLFGKK